MALHDNGRNWLHAAHVHEVKDLTSATFLKMNSNNDIYSES